MPEYPRAKPRKHELDPDDEALVDLLDARTTALRQARDDVQRLRVTAMDIYVQCGSDGQRERVTKHLRKIDEALATIEAALGEGAT